MNVQSTNKQKGFTIIEVVLVLAIAGLIFLMVFIALPALQRNQRDTQRRSDVSRINTQINNYQTNSRGDIPKMNEFTAGTTGFVTKYLKGSGSTADPTEYADPSTGEGYTFKAQSGDISLATGEIQYATDVICGPDGVPTAANHRNYVLRIHLEGQSSPYCIDNRS